MGARPRTERQERPSGALRDTYPGLFSAAMAGAGATLLLTWFADPSIGVHDSGELATGAHFLGVTHPAGSPLWLLLARFLELLPLAGSPAARMALLSALAGGVAAGIAALLLSRWGASGPSPALLGLAVVLVPRLLWTGQMVEVYALQTAAVLSLLLAIELTTASPRPGTAALVGLAGGVALSIHHGLAPAVVVAVALTGATVRPRGRGVVAGLAGLAAGLTPYVTIPVRALARPAHCWGDPSTPERLWAHLTSAQYRSDILAEAPAGPRLAEALAGLVGWLGWGGLLLAAAGVVVLLRRRPLAAATVILVTINELGVFSFAQTMPLSSEAYLTVTSVLLALAAAAAASTLLERAPRLKWLAALVPLALITVHGEWLQRDTGAARWTTARLFAASPRGSVVWLREDSTAFSAVYHQLVEGWRPDLTLLHPWSVVGAPHLPPDLILDTDREAAAAARRVSDRCLVAVAAAEGRAVLHQDLIHHSLSARLSPAGALWALTPPPAPAAQALLSPLPGEASWRRHPDPTVRGLLASQHLPLAFTRRRLGDPGRPRFEAELAWKCGSTFAAVHRALGQGWLDLDLPHEAVAELERALALDPAPASVWLAMGVARARTGALDDAEAAWRRASELRPDWAPPMVNLGRAALVRGDRAAARSILHQAWSATGDPEARRLLDSLDTSPPFQAH